MEKKTLHIIPHSHWDREWYMGFERHRMRLVELFDTLIRVMEENPDYTYYHMDGQYVVIQDYLEVRPQMKDRLLALIRADRIQVGPWYVLQDEYLTSGEANVRNMLYGIRLCRELGADPVMTGYFPDAFGNISQVPQILRGFGIDNAAFGRGVSEVGADNAIGVKRNPSEWRWRSPDGSEIVGVMFAHWYHNAMELPTDKEKLAPRLETLIRDCEASAYTPHLLGLNGCDHEPVQTDLPEAIKAANELLAGQDITVRQSNFKEYVAAVKPYAASFPQVTGELNGQGTNGMHLLINTASTHIPLKQRNHRGQNLLTQQAEPVSVLAAREGDTYRDDMLLFAWKKLMENHPHDSICSCSSDEVTDEMVSRFEHSRQVGEYVRDEAMDYLRHHVTAAEKSVLVCHTTAGTETATVTATLDYPEDTAALTAVSLIAPDGAVIPAVLQDNGRTFTYTLPKTTFRKPRYVHRYTVTFPVTMTGIGYALYTVREEAAPAAAAITVTARGAETATMKLAFAENGTFAVTDKKSGVTYSGLNEYEDVADAGESYNFVPLADDVPVSTAADTARIWIERQSPAAVTFGVENRWALPVGRDGKARKTETVETVITAFVTLTAGIDRVDVRTTFDNQSEDHRVRALFRPHIETEKSLADGQFDLVERGITPWKEWINPSNCQRCQAFFALEDAARGLAVAGRGLHEFEILRDGENTMALTLLRCVGYMGDWGVFPTPHMQCKGVQTLEYAVVPYAAADREQAFALAHSFADDAFVTGDVDAQAGSLPLVQTLVAVDAPALVTSACKRSEDKRATVLRLYNPLCRDVDATLTLDSAVKELYASDLAEHEGEALPIADGKAKLTVPAKKIVTYRFR